MAAKRDRMEEGNDSSAKRPRESTSAVVFQEVAMLLQDAEVGTTGEQQHLDAVLSKAMKSDHALRSVSFVEHIFPTCVCFAFVEYLSDVCLFRLACRILIRLCRPSQPCFRFIARLQQHFLSARWLFLAVICSNLQHSSSD
jgi:hypothetical protein